MKIFLLLSALRLYKGQASKVSTPSTSRRTLVVRRIFLRKMRLHRSGCRSSPQKVSLRLHCSLASALTTFRLATNFLRIFPTFPQPGTGRARCPACSFFSSLLPPDPYLTHTVFPWVWVKLWSGYRRIPALGFFLIIAAVPALRPFSWLPPAGRWW